MDRLDPNIYNYKNMAMSTDLNTEKFIEDVFERPAIWNRNFQGNKVLIDETWDNISSLHNLSVPSLKSKWKGLRDMFRVEYKRIPRNANGDLLVEPSDHQSRWGYYRSLLFLIEHMRTRPTYKTRRYREQYTDHGSVGSGNDMSRGATMYDEEYEDSVNNDPFSSYAMQSNDFLSLDPPLASNEIITADDVDDDVIEIPDLSPTNSNEMQNFISVKRSNKFNNKNSNYSNNNYNYNNNSNNNNNNNNITDINNSNSNKMKRKRYRMSDIINNFNGSTSNTNAANINALDASGDDSIDDDYHFLLSLHPYMMQLSHHRKLNVRMEIHDLIFKELYDDKNIK